jgi:hypothetical protein
MSSITVVGNGQAITTGTTANVVLFQNSVSNTFDITNASTTVYAYVGVFNSNVQTSFHHPSVGSANIGLVLTPGQTRTVTGNFNQGEPGNVWVASITNTGSTTVFATPITTVADVQRNGI